MCNKCRSQCADCQSLIEQHGEENLAECPYCGHYYYGPKCTCTKGQEEE